MRWTHPLLPLLLTAVSATRCSSGAHPAPASASAEAMPSAPAKGTVIGQFRENQFGVWHEWQPAVVGAPLPFAPEGWATQREAEKAVIAMAEDTWGRPSLVAILATGDGFVARFLEDEGGGDLRSWHVQMEMQPQSAQWVSTVDGPTMSPRVSAQTQSRDWCKAYVQGSWGTAPATADTWVPDVDPALLDELYRRRTRFDDEQVQEWAADGGPASLRQGTVTYVTDKGQCRVTLDLGDETVDREISPDTDDSMHLVVPGSSSLLLLTRLAGDEAQPPN